MFWKQEAGKLTDGDPEPWKRTCLLDEQGWCLFGEDLTKLEFGVPTAATSTEALAALQPSVEALAHLRSNRFNFTRMGISAL